MVTPSAFFVLKLPTTILGSNKLTVNVMQKIKRFIVFA
jgi:hypothetical protein